MPNPNQEIPVGDEQESDFYTCPQCEEPFSTFTGKICADCVARNQLTDCPRIPPRYATRWRDMRDRLIVARYAYHARTALLVTLMLATVIAGYTFAINK